MSWTTLFEKVLPDNPVNQKQAKQEILSKSGDPAPTTPNTPKAEMFPSNEGEKPVTSGKVVRKKKNDAGETQGPIDAPNKENAVGDNTGSMGSHGKKTTSFVTESVEEKKAKKAGVAMSLIGAIGATNPAGNEYDGMAKGDAPSDSAPKAPKENSVKGKTAFPSGNVPKKK